jgi:hypothetical protein
MRFAYLQFKDRYIAAPYYTEEGFAAMKGLIPAHREFIQRVVGIQRFEDVVNRPVVQVAFVLSKKFHVQQKLLAVNLV